MQLNKPAYWCGGEIAFFWACWGADCGSCHWIRSGRGLCEWETKSDFLLCLGLTIRNILSWEKQSVCPVCLRCYTPDSLFSGRKRGVLCRFPAYQRNDSRFKPCWLEVKKSICVRVKIIFELESQGHATGLVPFLLYITQGASGSHPAADQKK